LKTSARPIKPRAAPVKYALIASAGIVLVVGGVVAWIRRRALVSAEASDDRRESHRPATLMGAGIAGLELLTAFPYFAAIAMIAGSGVSDVGKLSLLVLYCVIYTLSLIVDRSRDRGDGGARRAHPPAYGRLAILLAGPSSSHRSPPRSGSAFWRSESCS
jgi:hypothetical protein